jgi:hypothetical protein
MGDSINCVWVSYGNENNDYRDNFAVAPAVGSSVQGNQGDSTPYTPLMG